MKFKLLFLLVLSTLTISKIRAQKTTTSDLPFVGAQVFIEPGQSDEEINGWFEKLHENNFTVCRIRVFEDYIRTKNGTYDYTLFDKAFNAAQKYNIEVYATIFPSAGKTNLGGFKLPSDEAHLKSIADFISNVVSHYSKYKCLRAWVLINEPGTGGKIPDTEFVRNKRKEWSSKNPEVEFTAQGYPVLMNVNGEAFLMDLNTWYLKWLAGEIKKYDTTHELHVNSHAIFENCAEYNFPQWSKFLNSLGGSAHASWHFNDFKSKDFTIAMSANSEIIRSGAGALPWIMTELQGGNNTFSGLAPMCPTAEEVSQWLWITTISGAKGNIFWSLNSRSSGVEAGEWALLDYQDNNSDRMDEAAKVAKTLADNKDLFANAKVVESGINILYVKESLWAEDKFVKYPFQKYEARKKGAVIKSALAYFEMFTEMGINTNFKSIDEYNFTLNDYSGETIILSHQICISVEYVKQLENFVAKGGTLIVDGLTGYFDENVQNTMKSNFLFENLFGANISEFKVVDDLFDMQIAGLNVKAHLWRGTLDVKTADVIGEYNGKAIAVQNQFGKGKVLYIPSMVGLASRKTEDYTALSQLVSNKLDLTKTQTGFGVWHKDVMMKTMYSGKSFISLIINKSGKAQEIGVTPPGNKLQPKIIFQNKKGIVTRNNININNEETIIIHWK